MKKTTNLKLVGIAAYTFCLYALLQVTVMPIVALLSILTIYKAKSDLIKSHAKYIICVMAGVSAVMLITANIFNGEQQMFAAMLAIAIAFMMLFYGGLCIVFARKPIK